MEEKREFTQEKRRRNNAEGGLNTNSRRRTPRKTYGNNKKEVSTQVAEIANKNAKREFERKTSPRKRVNSRERTQEKVIANKAKLKIIPLGGLHEIGKNITVFEYEEDMIVVDCGLSFPEDGMLGVDLVIPDITYIVKNQEKLKGIVITHGHEDHIGGVPYFLKQVNTPIYGTKLT